MKVKVKNLNVTGYTFKGTVNLGGLTAPVHGTFFLEWDDQYPTVRINETSMQGLVSYNMLDFRDLALRIKQKDTGVWYHDRMNILVEEANKEAV